MVTTIVVQYTYERRLDIFSCKYSPNIFHLPAAEVLMNREKIRNEQPKSFKY